MMVSLWFWAAAVALGLVWSGLLCAVINKT